MVDIKEITFTAIKDFIEIPLNPTETDFWMVEKDIAVWFTTYDRRWRFLLLMAGQHTRRSGESFGTWKEIKAFYDAGKNPTWVKGAITNDN